MDYGSATGTGVLAATGITMSIATGVWLPMIALVMIGAGILLVRFGFRRHKSVDDI